MLLSLCRDAYKSLYIKINPQQYLGKCRHSYPCGLSTQLYVDIAFFSLEHQVSLRTPRQTGNEARSQYFNSSIRVMVQTRSVAQFYLSFIYANVTLPHYGLHMHPLMKNMQLLKLPLSHQTLYSAFFSTSLAVFISFHEEGIKKKPSLK